MYVRLSIAKPRRGEEQRLEELFQKLAEVTAESEGCLQSHVMKPHDDSGEIARLSIYRDEAAAEKAASSARVMALRSEMHLLSEAGHQERAFFTT